MSLKNIVTKKNIMLGIAVAATIGIAVSSRYFVRANTSNVMPSKTVGLKAINSQIMVSGTVRSQNEASLHFLTGGKVVYLPFKEGDYVRQGQTIASLDTFTIQQQLNAALNSYRIAKTNYDQTLDNSQDKYLKEQMTTPYNFFSLAKLNGDEKTQAINDAMQRIVNISEATKDNAQVQVEIAKYAFTLASINTPINGQIIHQDITTPNVIATTQTAFNIVDPSTLIFKANIPEDEINYVEEGTKATIKLNGDSNSTIDATVIKIYPDKVTLPNGENVYQADIASPQLNTVAKYKQAGVVLITNKYEKKVILAPTWLILGGNQIWVLDDNKPVLKQITIGEQNGADTEITSGLNENDKIIMEPRSIISSKYIFL